MNVHEKLMQVQTELKAPKGQYNSFGKYKYRSCEDILESVKPLLAKVKATIVIGDELQNVGERYYIKATAKFVDIESGDSVENTALARESLTKKGMDDSQVTGTASSYARKYCLNGLLLIDDTKDADTDAYHEQTHKDDAPKEEPKKQKPAKVASKVRIERDKNGKEVVSIQGQGGYLPIERLETDVLLWAVNRPEYMDAVFAINAELDRRNA